MVVDNQSLTLYGWTRKSAWTRGTGLDKEECMDTWYRTGQGRVHGHVVQGWTRKKAWTCSTELDKEECVATWYRAGQRRVHGHMVQSWTRKSAWTHGTRLDKEECMDTWYRVGQKSNICPLCCAERAYAETCHVNGLDRFFGFDSTVYCYPKRQWISFLQWHGRFQFPLVRFWLQSHCSMKLITIDLFISITLYPTPLC